MATDYTGINRPYDSNMNRVDYPVGNVGPQASYQTNTPGQSISYATQIPDPPTLPGQDDNRVLPDRNFDDLWINKSIKSRGFLPHAKGFWLDGKTGDAQFNNIELVGGVLRYKKTSFTDSSHSGYFIGPEGIYFGSAGDTTFLKYDINSGTLVFVGTFETSTSGKRVVLSSSTDTLEFFDGISPDAILSIGATSGSGGGHIFITQSSGDSLPALRVTGDNTTTTSAVQLFSQSSTSNSFNKLLEINSKSQGSPAVDILMTNSGMTDAVYSSGLNISGNSTIHIAFIPLLSFQNSLTIYYGLPGFSPNGQLPSTVGSLVFSKGGNIFVCQGGTLWLTASLTP